MRILASAKAKGLTPQLILGIIVVEGVFNHYGKECVITSLNDSVHSEKSKHYEGNGVDFRIKHLDGDDAAIKADDISMAKLIVSDCRSCLGNDYDIVLESNHIHLEYDPK